MKHIAFPDEEICPVYGEKIYSKRIFLFVVTNNFYSVLVFVRGILNTTWCSLKSFTIFFFLLEKTTIDGKHWVYVVLVKTGNHFLWCSPLRDCIVCIEKEVTYKKHCCKSRRYKNWCLLINIYIASVGNKLMSEKKNIKNIFSSRLMFYVNYKHEFCLCLSLDFISLEQLRKWLRLEKFTLNIHCYKH